MSDDFEKSFCLCLIYSKDLKRILLRKVKHGKLDALLIEAPESGIEHVHLSRVVNDELGLQIIPARWQIITSLQNIEKKWKIDVYLTASEIETVNKEGFELHDPLKLPENCHPNLIWIVPMSIDFTVFGSSFNQILMK